MDLSTLNPFQYSLAQVKATMLQLVAIAVLLLGFFVFLDPGTEAAWQAVITAIFSVIGVFAAKNATPDSINKSLTSLVASVIGVITLYGGDVASDTGEKIGLIIGALIPPLLVLFSKNARVPTPAVEPPLEPSPEGTTLRRPKK